MDTRNTRIEADPPKGYGQYHHPGARGAGRAVVAADRAGPAVRLLVRVDPDRDHRVHPDMVVNKGSTTSGTPDSTYRAPPLSSHDVARTEQARTSKNEAGTIVCCDQRSPGRHREQTLIRPLDRAESSDAVPTSNQAAIGPNEITNQPRLPLAPRLRRPDVPAAWRDEMVQLSERIAAGPRSGLVAASWTRRVDSRTFVR